MDVLYGPHECTQSLCLYSHLVQLLLQLLHNLHLYFSLGCALVVLNVTPGMILFGGIVGGFYIYTYKRDFLVSFDYGSAINGKIQLVTLGPPMFPIYLDELV